MNVGFSVGDEIAAFEAGDAGRIRPVTPGPLTVTSVGKGGVIRANDADGGTHALLPKDCVTWPFTDARGRTIRHGDAVMWPYGKTVGAGIVEGFAVDGTALSVKVVTAGSVAVMPCADVIAVHEWGDDRLEVVADHDLVDTVYGGDVRCVTYRCPRCSAAVENRYGRCKRCGAKLRPTMTDGGDM